MSSTAHYRPLKIKANSAAADTYGAVATGERFAAFVSFQRQLASFPPAQNVNSAVSPLLPASQFSGSIANGVANAVPTATSLS